MPIFMVKKSALEELNTATDNTHKSQAEPISMEKEHLLGGVVHSDPILQRASLKCCIFIKFALRDTEQYHNIIILYKSDEAR